MDIIKSSIPDAVLPDIVKFDSWIAGESPIEYKDRNVKWHDYTSRPEPQNIGFETYSCVSYSALNCIETLMNFKIKKGEFSEINIKWLKDNGYFNDEEKIDFSDRFLAIMSGTTKQGNSCDNVAEVIRKKGLIPESDFPMGGKNFEQYHEKKLITDSMLNKGQEFLKRFTVQHDFILIQGSKVTPIQALSYYTLSCPIQVTAPVCPGWHNEKVKACPLQISQHATMTCGVFAYYDQLDQYKPFFKELALDYPLLWGKRYDIIENVPEPIPTFKFTKNIYMYETSDDVEELQKILIKEGLLDIPKPTRFFGNLTRVAVMRLQNLSGIPTNYGVVAGIKTRGRLNELLNK